MSQPRTLSHHDAARILVAVRSELEPQHQGAAIAVVDGHGELMAFLRTDGCDLPSIVIAINKAYTAARTHIESGALGKRSHEEGFPMTNFGDLRYVTWGGGVPVVVDGHIIGAVGVSGLAEEVDIELARMGAGLVTE